MTDRHCAQCGAPLQHQRADANTCSDKCRVAFHRERQKLMRESGIAEVLSEVRAVREALQELQAQVDDLEAAVRGPQQVAVMNGKVLLTGLAQSVTLDDPLAFWEKVDARLSNGHMKEGE